jgi:hypothetical protein
VLGRCYFGETNLELHFDIRGSKPNTYYYYYAIVEDSSGRLVSAALEPFKPSPYGFGTGADSIRPGQRYTLSFYEDSMPPTYLPPTFGLDPNEIVATGSALCPLSPSGDTTPPVLTLHGDTVVEATSEDGAVVTYTITAQDDRDGTATLEEDGITLTQDDVEGNILISCGGGDSHPSGSVFPLGVTELFCVASDASGNDAGEFFTVTVNPSSPADTTPPVITVPEDITAEATGPDGAEISFEVTAEDALDGQVDVTCIPDSGSIFPLGETIVECSATDAAGNTGTGSFTVTIQDTTPPVISVPDDITEEATNEDGAEVSFEEEVTSEDDVDGVVDVSCDYDSGDTFPIGETVVTCSAEDAAGNRAEESFTVTVQDTTAPDVEITKAVDRRRNTEIPNGGITPIPYIQITFEATDAVGIDSIECSLDGQAFTSCESPVSYDRLSRGTHEVTVRVTDEAGNTGEDEFTWTVGSPPSNIGNGGRNR